MLSRSDLVHFNVRRDNPMKFYQTLLAVATMGSADCAVTYSFEMEVFSGGDFSSSFELSGLIEISDTPLVTSFSYDFQVTAVLFQGAGFQQEFTGLDDPGFTLSILKPFPDNYIFEATIPLPQGVLGAGEPLFFHQGFEPLFSAEMLDEFETVEATDFAVFFDGADILGEGNMIAPISELDSFVDGYFNDSTIAGGGSIQNLVAVPEPSTSLYWTMGFLAVLRRKRMSNKA